MFINHWAILLLVWTLSQPAAAFQSGSPLDGECKKAEKLVEGAQKLYDSRLPEKALPKLSSAVKKAPFCVRAHLLLAHCYWDLDLLEEAEAAYQKVIQLDPSQPEAKGRLSAARRQIILKRATNALKEQSWSEARKLIDEFRATVDGAGLNQAIAAICSRFSPEPKRGFTALLKAFRDGSRFEECRLIDAAWSSACPDCDFDRLTEKGATLLQAGDQAAVDRTRTELGARLQGAEVPIIEVPNAEFLAYCGWPFKEAQMVTQTIPNYTTTATAKKITGTIMLIGIVETDGRVRELRLIKGLEPSLETATIDKIRNNWIFEPATIGDRPVRQRALIEITFAMNTAVLPD